MAQIGIIILAVLNILIAAHHANLIKKMEQETLAYGKPKTKIYHAIWGGAFALLACAMAWGVDKGVFQSVQVERSNPWLFLLTVATSRMAIFSPALNLFRGLNIFHTSPEIKNTKGVWTALWKGKIIDWLHFQIFKNNSHIYYPAYFIISIVLTIIL